MFPTEGLKANGMYGCVGDFRVEPATCLLAGCAGGPGGAVGAHGYTGQERHVPEALWPQAGHHLRQEPAGRHPAALEENSAPHRRAWASAAASLQGGQEGRSRDKDKRLSYVMKTMTG